MVALTDSMSSQFKEVVKDEVNNFIGNGQFKMEEELINLKEVRKYNNWGDEDAESNNEQVFGDVQLKLELRDRVDNLFKFFHKLSSLKTKNVTLRNGPLGLDSSYRGDPYMGKGLLYKLLTMVLGKYEVPGLEYHSSAVGRLFKSGFGRFGLGQPVPVDGEVSQGRSTITIEHLTGEAKPVEMKVGDRIPGGARNLDGMMIVKVTKTWNESTLNRIVQLTEEAQLNKLKLQRWLDEFGEQYSKVVVALSLGVAILGPFLFK